MVGLGVALETAVDESMMMTLDDSLMTHVTVTCDCDNLSIEFDTLP